MEERIKIKVYEPDQHRYKFQPHQLQVLNEIFSINPNPPNKIKRQLAVDLDIPFSKVQVWFNNRKRGTKLQKSNKQPLSNSNVMINIAQEARNRVDISNNNTKFFSISDLINNEDNLSNSYPPLTNQYTYYPSQQHYNNEKNKENYCIKENENNNTINHFHEPILRPKDLISNLNYDEPISIHIDRTISYQNNFIKPHLAPISYDLKAKGLDSSPLSI